jgi:malonyl-CoA O-methyltransferase
LDKQAICLESLVVPDTSRALVVEGAGGVLVPLNDSHLMIDLIRAFHFPTLVVARTTLGTINHTLLTLESLRSRGTTVRGVILNGPPHPANRQAIEKYGNVSIIGELPPLCPLNANTLAQTAPPPALESLL